MFESDLLSSNSKDALEGVVDKRQLERGAVQYVNCVKTVQVLTRKQHTESFHIVPAHGIMEDGQPVAVQAHIHIRLLQEQPDHLVVVFGKVRQT